MPKVQKDYKNTVIYKIVCNDLEIKDTYAGHTTNFTKRKSQHKSACSDINNKNYNCKVYRIIRNNQGWDNWTMVEIEKYPCNDLQEATKRERYFYELLNSSLNSQYPARMKAEYIATHKLETRNIGIKYREKNNEVIKLKKKTPIVCECGCISNSNHMNRHKKSKKHLDIMSQNIA